MTEFPHQFIPSDRSDRVLLLLHGTGGDETDLLSLGRAIDPEAALLSPRGRVSEKGANRYFRRLAEGVFDEEDVIARAHELAEWIAWAVGNYAMEKSELVVTGYSNGANIASAMMLLGEWSFHEAILLRPMVPLHRATQADLKSSRILLGGGERDPIATPTEVGILADLLEKNGAQVTRAIQPAGHELTSADIRCAREWLAGVAFA